MRRTWIYAAALGFIVLGAGCNSGPTPPQPGTPEFMWSAAKSTYAAGDYLKANDNLTQLAKGTSEYAARSRPLAIVLTSGIAKAYAELADNFETGAQANRNNPTPFRRQVNLFRSEASAAAVQTAESVHEFLQSNPPEAIAMELAYPSGFRGRPGIAAEGGQGNDSAGRRNRIRPERDDPEGRAARHDPVGRRGRGHRQGASRSSRRGNVKMAKPVFAFESAKVLMDLADLYSPKKLGPAEPPQHRDRGSRRSPAIGTRRQGDERPRGEARQAEEGQENLRAPRASARYHRVLRPDATHNSARSACARAALRRAQPFCSTP